jgi:hypothetical protein
MGLLKPYFHYKIYIGSLAVALASLPYSNFSLSIGIIALGINWVAEGRWVEKLSQLRQRTSVLIFSLIFLSLLVGFFYSTNFAYALKEIKLKLPLLFIPIIIVTSKPIATKEFLFLLCLFGLSVFVATIISTSIFIDKYFYGSGNVRDISPFISHIRFSLMVALSFFISMWFFAKKVISSNKWILLLLLFTSIWFVTFLFILQSLTGILALAGTLFILLIISVIRIKHKVFKFAAVVLLLLLSVIPVSYLTNRIDSYFTRNDVSPDELAATTANGNPFTHDTDTKEYENGNLLWVNVCWDEMERVWPTRSSIPFDGKDGLGQAVSYTVLRYLTSKGLTKDSLGITKLDAIDIELIESGVTSVIFRQYRFGVYPRLYQLLWEIDQYRHFGRISGSPFIQRLIYIKAAVHIISNNFFFGVGTGDFLDEFHAYYRVYEPKLEKRYWYPSHNQFITRFVTLGLWGFIVFIAAWFLPLFIEKAHRRIIALAFFSIITISMLNEDTFLTHIGVSFTALFYGLLVFGWPICEEDDPQKAK